MTTNNEEEFHICGETGDKIKYEEEDMVFKDEEDCECGGEFDICEVCNTPKCIYCGLCDCIDLFYLK